MKPDAADAVEIWGDGSQTLSFSYINDCLERTRTLLHSNVWEPVDIGSDVLISIPGLVDRIEELAGVKVERTYDPTKLRGVWAMQQQREGRRRSGLVALLPLREGVAETFRWFEDQVRRA